MFDLSSKNTRVHEMFEVDKYLAFLKLMKVTGLCSIPKILCSNSCLHLDIAETGRKTMFLFYNCKTLKSKNKLHHQILVGRVTTAKSFVTPDFFFFFCPILLQNIMAVTLTNKYLESY